jgi:YHS domain-containing protein
MKVMCNQCGKVQDLMTTTSFALEESGQLKTYHFCSDAHMMEFARKKGLPLGKD